MDDGQAEGAYWTTRDEDPDVAAVARALAASQIALELDGEELIERTQENIRLLHDIVDTAHEAHPDSDLGYYRAWPSATARETIGEHLTDTEIAEKAMYGGWNPDRDPYLRVNKDGDWVGMDTETADRLVWDNRAAILKSVGTYAEDMPVDVIGHVCVMAEQASSPKPAPDPWIDGNMGFSSSEMTLPEPDPGIGQDANDPAMGPGIGM